MPSFLIKTRPPALVGLSALALVHAPFLSALAEEAGHGEAGAHQGMPQLDPAHFATQIFWTAVAFIVLYRLMVKRFVPSIESVLDERRARISSDIDAATAAKAEADRALAAAEKAAADARAAAHAEIASVVEAAEAVARERHERSTVEVKERIAAAEASINAAKNAIVAELGSAVADLTRDIVERTAGFVADASLVESAVEAAVKERG